MNLRPRNPPSSSSTGATKKARITPEKNTKKNTMGDAPQTVDHTAEEIKDNAEREKSSMGDSETSLKFKPSKYLPKECTEELVDVANVGSWWVKQEYLIQTSFGEFVQQDYFVNKFKFLEELLVDTNRCNAIFLPSGCGKTVMSVSLEYFFSYKISAEDRNIIRPFYSKYVDEEKLEKHEGQYYVLRISFRDLILYQRDERFKITLNRSLEALIRHYLEPELFKDEKFDEKVNDVHFFVGILRWLYTKYQKKLIVIIDEMDYPVTKYLNANASAQKMETMLQDYRDFLCILQGSTWQENTFVEKVILFGIHLPPKVIDICRWKCFYITSEENCASLFLFSRDEVEKLLTKYDRLAELDKVEKHYGGYNDEYFLPASVVAYVYKGKFAVYKLSFRSDDVLNIDGQSIKSTLLKFVGGKLHKEHLNRGLLTFSQPSVARDPILHCAYAGLLCVSFDGEGVHVGNVENRSIIAGFRESIKVDLPSNPALLMRQVDLAFENFDLIRLSEAANGVLRMFKATELVDESCYQSAMQTLFCLAAGGWKVQSEVDEGTGDQTTGASGQTHLLVSNDEEEILYIFKLKHLQKTTEKPLDRSNKEVARLFDRAFEQIEMKVYVGVDEKEKFEKIYKVAVVCCGNMVAMEGRSQDLSK